MFIRTILLLSIILPSLCCSQQIESEGWAEIVNFNVSQAMDQAKKRAFRNAIEQGLGVYLETESITANGKLLQDKILSNSEGYIQEYKVLSSDQQGNIIKVRILATVSKEKIGIDLLKIIKDNSDPRIAFLIKESNLGEIASMPITETELMREFTEYGFHVVSPYDVNRAWETLTNSEAVQIGQRLKADIIVVGEAKSLYVKPFAEVHSKCSATANIRLINIYNQRLLDAQSLKASAHDVLKEDAGTKALQKVSTQMGEILKTNLIKHFMESVMNPESVHITIIGINSSQQPIFESKLLEFGVNSSQIHRRHFDNNIGEWDIEFPGSQAYYSDKIEACSFNGFFLSCTDYKEKSIKYTIVD